MNDKFRMYGFVPYNLSPIQQGIQFGHAVQEFNNLVIGNKRSSVIHNDFHEWRLNCKTFIILNGGTTNNNKETLGTLNKIQNKLDDMGIFYSTFNEPDLGNQLTAITFLVNEMVYNREKYPEYSGNTVFTNVVSPMEPDYTNWKIRTFGTIELADKVIQLREFLSNFRLA